MVDPIRIEVIKGQSDVPHDKQQTQNGTMSGTQNGTHDEFAALARVVEHRILALPEKRKDRLLRWHIASMSKVALEDLARYLDVEEHCSKSDS